MRNVYRPALRKQASKEPPGTHYATLRRLRRVMAGVDLYSVKEFLGHADYETTLPYAHLASDYLKTVVRNGSLGMEMLAPNPNSNPGNGPGPKLEP